MTADFDFSEVVQLEQDLGEVPVKMIPLVRKAVEVTARHIKDDWREEATRSSGIHAKHYPFTVDYDMKLNADGAISAEIGPNMNRSQGTLGFLEDAPGGVRATPQHAGRKAVKKNEEDFTNGLLKAAEDAMNL